MNTEFTTMLYDRKHLVIRNEADRNPLVICECYLLESAETICAALIELEKQKGEKTND